MYFSASSFTVIPIVLAALAAATHTITVTTYASTPTPPPASQCNTSDYTAATASSSVVAPLLALLDIVVAPVTALVGSTCSPINIAGVGSGGQCTAQPVCCQNNHFNILIVIGCTPITVGL
ncbi:fungal hydrophobin-domain-containing protein [Crassisporium funariophilum]|nr:fungal hydrophobin-domain-containing protein [Crassisporium funariophilum]KAF8163776.1 fungal hydrophobin-domain-containing protein [Crassisporium funariophilum]